MLDHCALAKNANKFKIKLTYLLCILFFPLQSSVLAADYEIVKNTIESRTLRLPQISIDGLDYKAISFEYAVEGDIKIQQKHKQSEKINCDGKPKNNHFFEVNYKGPQIIFNIKDNKKVRNLYTKQFNTDAMSYFNQNNCLNIDDLDDHFARMRSEWKKELKAKIIREAINEMETFVAEHAAPSHQHYTLPLFAIDSNHIEFDSFKQAYDLAIEGFRLNNIYSLTFSGMKTFKQAAQNWEGELRRLKATGAEKNDLLLALHRNLTVTYFFGAEYANALYHNEQAIQLGMPSEESLEKTLRDYQYNQGLSPIAAKNIINQLNAWRIGHEIVQHIKLKEVEYHKLALELVNN